MSLDNVVAEYGPIVVTEGVPSQGSWRTEPYWTMRIDGRFEAQTYNRPTNYRTWVRQILNSRIKNRKNSINRRLQLQKHLEKQVEQLRQAYVQFKEGVMEREVKIKLEVRPPRYSYITNSTLLLFVNDMKVAVAHRDIPNRESWVKSSLRSVAKRRQGQADSAGNTFGLTSDMSRFENLLKHVS